jgi:chorismate dehydratase
MERVHAPVLEDLDVAYRFSVLSYANALPLVHFIGVGSSEAELVYGPPRDSVRGLLEGQVDAALVPVVDFFTHPQLQMVPGLGIGADGDVTSVLLRCHRPLQQVTRIDLDPESKTSNVLVRVLVQRHFHLSDRVTYMRDQADADANVCIGDRALRAQASLETYDLAGEWKKMTGLPFVFAVWVVQRSCPHVEDITRILQAAQQRGCQSQRELAGLCSRRLGLPEPRCYDYLTKRLHYDVGPRELEGMDLFRAWTAEFLGAASGQAIHTVTDHRRKHETPTLELS